MNAFIIGILTFSVAYFSLFVGRFYGRQYLLDIPNQRSSHTIPTPKGGGIVIVLCTLMAYLMQGANELQFAYAAAAGFIAAVSFWDDWHPLPALFRLMAHLAGALWVVSTLSHHWLTLLFFVVWLTTLTNFYNFMDGIDGLAGMQAVLGGVNWLIFSSLTQDPTLFYVAVVLTAASLAFLSHNWPPAKIFMGDVGSAFLGFTFAFLTLYTFFTHNLTLAIASSLFLWLFIFDATFTLLRRLLRGEKILEAHRSHLYQRLVIAGYTHRAVTLFYFGGGVLGCFLGWQWSVLPFFYSWPTLIGVIVWGFMLTRLVIQAERQIIKPS